MPLATRPDRGRFKDAPALIPGAPAWPGEITGGLNFLSLNVKSLPGVQAPYEAPLSPELVISGAKGTPADGAAEVTAQLERRGRLKP